MENFTVKDSGKREEFGTGAVRDTATDKPRPDLMQFAQGDASEDHLSAAVFNLMAIIHNQEVTRRGVQLRLPTIPGNLNDFPVFIKDEEMEL